MFDAAIGGAPSPDPAELMENRELSAYFNTPDFADAGVRIYPNPARNIVHISLSDDGNTGQRLEIIDVSGRKIIQETVTRWPAEIDVTPLKSGICMVVVNGLTTKTGTLIRE